MKRLDILLLIAAGCVTAGAVMVAVPLGLFAAGVCAGAAWFMLGDS